MSLLSDALDRLKKYNLGPFSLSSNPFGLTGAGGPDTNLEPMLGDVATVGQASADNAIAAEGSAAAAADSEDAAAGSAQSAQQDAQATAADRQATGLDRQATAADRQAVAQDRTAVEGSASAASTSATLSGQYAAAAGGAVPSVRLAWDTGTADADPGNGKVRLNSATVTAATALYVDNLDAAGASITTVLDRWTASTNTTKGTLRIAHRTDATKWLEFQVTGTVVDGTGYRKITVTGGTGPGGFGADDPVAVGFVRAGDVGAQGPAGPAGATGPTGATGDTGAVGPVGPITTYWCGTAGGTANALTAITSSGLSSLTRGQVVGLKIGAAANSGAATLNVDGIGGKAIQKNGAALVGGELVAGSTLFLQYDGAAFQLVGGSGSGPVNFPSTGQKTGAYTVTIADAGKLIPCSGTWTLSLPSVVAAGNGAVIPVANNGTGTITIDPAGTETANGSGAVAIAPGGNVILVSDGVSNWTVFGAISSITTLDPSAKGASVVLSNGNLSAKNPAGSWSVVRSTASVPSGKFYVENRLEVTDAGPGWAMFGLAASTVSMIDGNNLGSGVANSWSLSDAGTLYSNTASTSGWSPAWSAAGKVVGLHIDTTNVASIKGWFSVDGVMTGGGDPATGTNPAFIITGSPTLYLAMALISNMQMTLKVARNTWQYTPASGYSSFP
ncbi:hypothetical protein SAMN02982917_5485 [Azospirillum oryzae]|uniref:Collagen triple helix repeat-containing protein n=1 Tax=Azospirillum oryzae TaxID=286727 RepID=A0A1X7HB98_9PROT|nr:hypothetical protein [Azospirillum oryzae]SMF83192.1 hypothetical protein SAMN02982917_5485 [Azospirillum oryzae]